VSNVVVDLSSGDEDEATVSPGTVTFTPENWDQAETVTVTGVNDFLLDGDQTTTITVSVDDDNSDDKYDAVADQRIDVITTDDDVAGFTVGEAGANTQVAESGTTDTFTVVLDAQPDQDVLISVASGDTHEATVDRADLTFTPTDWDNAQEVTVTGVDDFRHDGDRTTTITLSVDAANSDKNFDHLADQTVSVTTIDDGYHGWQNPANPFDVDGDGHVTTQDVLDLINHINSYPDSSLPSGVGPPYLDVNGDNSCTPLDALSVINEINNPQGSGEGEGEAIQSPASSSLTELPLPAPLGSPSSDLTYRLASAPRMGNDHISAHDERVTAVRPILGDDDNGMLTDVDRVQQPAADAVWDEAALEELDAAFAEVETVLTDMAAGLS
jgi:hypothetical protein